ncbi:hypothetical protein [Methylicorpusculum sp.]|uniref:hypothetical protein n=1 Tax=Methylicorpusculum sp. TaxID=2713644 RepID=UPI002718157B|nr:hypothetical protein [Methylicorpusculum sp.]MDO8846029.1 hypothetical protein [Methylicorpusculum sp.]MDO9241223.1 hypothetical protein [Methylicorpusculum sp.]MDP2179468.1 hypothetical protein [Methylicorpusculum sp.]MDP3530243.1 hypothetical protein [Methylicorpusculum sp.]MDZ4153361.1 hypothetical protein [Methylicorpusculum sp.]
MQQVPDRQSIKDYQHAAISLLGGEINELYDMNQIERVKYTNLDASLERFFARIGLFQWLYMPRLTN